CGVLSHPVSFGEVKYANSDKPRFQLGFVFWSYPEAVVSIFWYSLGDILSIRLNRLLKLARLLKALMSILSLVFYPFECLTNSLQCRYRIAEEIMPHIW